MKSRCFFEDGKKVDASSCYTGWEGDGNQLKVSSEFHFVQ